MKKLFVIGAILLFGVQTYHAYNMNSSDHIIKLENINSKNILSYIKENKLDEKIKSICSNNLCSDINLSSLEADIKSFITKNLDYLKKKNSDFAIEAELKGFLIDRIILDS